MRNLLLLSFMMIGFSSWGAYAQEAAAPPVQDKNTPLVDNLKTDALEARDQATEDYTVIKQEVETDSLMARDNMAARANRIANNARDGLKQTAHRLREWWLTPLPEEHLTPVPPSYCYKALQDVMCYRQPMPGWEHRLVGYQGTGAEPPAAAMMKALPQRTVDTTKQAENRVASAKPVFVNLPPDEKKAENNEEPVAVDSSHETLPDPTLAPQL